MVKRDIRDYLNDILTHIELAQSFIQGMTYQEFESDEKTKLALSRAIEIVGEAIKNVPDSMREQYPDIAWRDIAGMRDKLAHQYFGINFMIVWETTHRDLPQLKPIIQSIIDDLTVDEQKRADN